MPYSGRSSLSKFLVGRAPEPIWNKIDRKYIPNKGCRNICWILRRPGVPAPAPGRIRLATRNGGCGREYISWLYRGILASLILFQQNPGPALQLAEISLLCSRKLVESSGQEDF